MLLLVDLQPFKVAQSFSGGVHCEGYRNLQSLIGWLAKFEETIGTGRVVKILCDPVAHTAQCQTWLGHNLAPCYQVDAHAFTGVHRIATVCASPCVAQSGTGATVGDLSNGERARFAVPAVDNVRLWARETLLDRSKWSPCKIHVHADPDAPSGLSHLWPTMLRSVCLSTDRPDGQTMVSTGIHKCQRCDDGTERFAGPAYFLRMLSWEETPYADVLTAYPCLGKIFVMNGASASASGADVGFGDASWVARCGDHVLCNTCAAVTEVLGLSWERRSLTDVIVRHAAARILMLMNSFASADCRAR